MGRVGILRAPPSVDTPNPKGTHDMIRRLCVVALAASALTLAACGADDSSSSSSGDCPTITEGKLTIGTGNAAYSPGVEEIGRAHV